MNEYYPQEFYIELTSNDNLLGRITVLKQAKSFSIEIDIVLKESRKIFKHVGSHFNLSDHQESIDFGMMKLSQFLDSVRK
ncbi:hypothetical protein [Bacteriovorax sp. Seq25_V]|uniref:hypothetical protein n=1 Tax=Bacteriovorax sp. Seq25_V TaxID=1201288 RepID=UPI00038A366A|nr:hypothetical protein [Bacteriovorax sp. Seq25_V]EQC43843.1 hypothetical protein M900_1197 [Bacteriovorax sp. Seq25_V]